MPADCGKKHLMNELDALEALDCFHFPGIGEIRKGNPFPQICCTKDRCAYFLRQAQEVLVYLPSQAGLPAYYAWHVAGLPEKIKAVLMDLDGSTVKSERFWISIIEEIARRCLHDDTFRFTDEDIPFVSGFSVSEHLSYIHRKYLAEIKNISLPLLRNMYVQIVKEKMQQLEKGRINDAENFFQPSEYLRDFLLELKRQQIKIGLVSSGVHEKAWPEIVQVFRHLELGDPLDFYDAIVTAGFSVRRGQAGTLGELEAKPHPWLYAEALHAMHVSYSEAVVIEDSSAGVVAARLARMPVIGMKEGNIVSSGTASLCAFMGSHLKEVYEHLSGRL